MLESWKIGIWIRDYLPIALRKPVFLAFARLLGYPIGYLYSAFLVFIRAKRNELKISTQTIVLEAYLNSITEFYVPGKRITIENVNPRPMLTCYLIRENYANPNTRAFFDAERYDQGEDFIGYDWVGLAYCIQISERFAYDGDFLVNLPSGFNFIYSKQLDAEINKYKVAGKRALVQKNKS